MFINLLPQDGTAIYYGPILSHKESADYFATLLQEIPWKGDKVHIFGKSIVTSRKVAWYGDQPYVYRYSGGAKKALSWTKPLLKLKDLVEHHAENTFNSCLLNLYHTGQEGMGWHSDDEAALGYQPIIASLSLGVERKFSFRHKQTKKSVSLTLEDGSLLVMKDATQTFWQHSLPKSKKVSAARINLTFRNIAGV